MNHTKLNTSPTVYVTEMSARFYDLHGNEHYVESLPFYSIQEYVTRLLHATGSRGVVVLNTNPIRRMNHRLVFVSLKDASFKTLGHIWLTDRPEPVLFKD